MDSYLVFLIVANGLCWALAIGSFISCQVNKITNAIRSNNSGDSNTIFLRSACNGPPKPTIKCKLPDDVNIPLSEEEKVLLAERIDKLHLAIDEGKPPYPVYHSYIDCAELKELNK